MAFIVPSRLNNRNRFNQNPTGITDEILDMLADTDLTILHSPLDIKIHRLNKSPVEVGITDEVLETFADHKAIFRWAIPTTFHDFNYFPKEVRLRIWGFACRESRVIQIAPMAPFYDPVSGLPVNSYPAPGRPQMLSTNHPVMVPEGFHHLWNLHNHLPSQNVRHYPLGSPPSAPLERTQSTYSAPSSNGALIEETHQNRKMTMPSCVPAFPVPLQALGKLSLKPSVLDATHESRVEALRHYIITDFGGQLRKATWFNNYIDTLFFVSKRARFTNWISSMPSGQWVPPHTIIMKHGIRKQTDRNPSSSEIQDFMEDILHTSYMFPGVKHIIVIGHSAGYELPFEFGGRLPAEQVQILRRRWRHLPFMRRQLGRYKVGPNDTEFLLPIPQNERVYPTLWILNWKKWQYWQEHDMVSRLS